MNTNMTRPNGDLTPYAFACGYVQSHMIDGSKGYYSTDANGVALYRDGCYHVKVREIGVTHDNEGFPYRVEGELQGWHTFDNLTDARKFYRKAVKHLSKIVKVVDMGK